MIGAGVILLGFATPLRTLWVGLGFWAPFALWALALGLLWLDGRNGEGA